MSILIYNQPRSIDFAGNQLFLKVRGSKGDLVFDDYHISAVFFVENLSAVGTTTSLPEFRLDTDDDDVAELFDFGEIIRSRFFNYFPLPDFSMTETIKAANVLIGYTVVLAEKDGDNQLSTLTVGEYKALNGRVNDSIHPNFDVRDWINTYRKFLTNAPAHIYTYNGAKQYLYYLNPYPNQISVLVQMVAVTFSGEQKYQSAYITINANETLVVPVMDIITAQFGQTTIEVQVWIEDNVRTMLAGVQTFHIIPKTLYARTFLFQNRYGVFDTLTIANTDNSFKTERIEGVRTLTPNYKTLDGNVSSEIALVDDTFEAETGPIPIATAQHYKEMAETRAVFLQDADRFVRVHIESGSFKIYDDTKDMQIVKFKYKPAFRGDLLNSQLDLPKGAPEDYSMEYLKTDYR